MKKIAIVIPCRNEKANIAECLHAIYACALPQGYSIVVNVVDGMSDDGTRELLNELQNMFPDLHVIDNTMKLTPFAFNLGIHAVPDADFYQIVGARHILSENYLIECVNTLLSNPEIWCVGGKIINEYMNVQGELIAKVMSTSLGMGLGNFRTLSNSGFTDTVTSPMYPKHVFEKIGYFDEDLIRNQDDDYNFRVAKAGGKIYFNADISLKYYVRGNVSQLAKQFKQYGYWKVFVNKKHATFTTWRQLVPPLFVLYLLFIPFAFLIHSWIGAGMIVPFILYLLLVSVESLRISKSFTTYPIVWIIFPILHVSYGWGYLQGIFRFIILNKAPKESAKTLSR